MARSGVGALRHHPDRRLGRLRACRSLERPPGPAGSRREAARRFVATRRRDPEPAWHRIRGRPPRATRHPALRSCRPLRAADHSRRSRWRRRPPPPLAQWRTDGCCCLPATRRANARLHRGGLSGPNCPNRLDVRCGSRLHWRHSRTTIRRHSQTWSGSGPMCGVRSMRNPRAATVPSKAHRAADGGSRCSEPPQLKRSFGCLQPTSSTTMPACHREGAAGPRRLSATSRSGGGRQPWCGGRESAMMTPACVV